MENGNAPPTEYHVQAVVGKRTRNGRVEYKIRWSGYTSEDDSWEGIENCHCEKMIDAYEKAREIVPDITPRKNSKNSKNSKKTPTTSKYKRYPLSSPHSPIDVCSSSEFPVEPSFSPVGSPEYFVSGSFSSATPAPAPASSPLSDWSIFIPLISEKFAKSTTTTTFSTSSSFATESPEYPLSSTYASTSSPFASPSSCPVAASGPASPSPSPSPSSSPNRRRSLGRKAKKPLPAECLDRAPRKQQNPATPRTRRAAHPNPEGAQPCEIIDTSTYYYTKWANGPKTQDPSENADFKCGDFLRLQPNKEDEYVHFVNKRFVDFLKQQQEKLFLKKKVHKDWIGQVTGFVQEDDGEWLVEVQYFWYPENTYLYFNEGLPPKLLFLVEEKALHPCDKIISKCEVKHETEISNVNEWITHEDHFFYQHIYSPAEHSFLTPPQFLEQRLEPKKSETLELFAGAGGMSHGLKQSGLPVTWAVELDEYAAETLRNFHPQTEVFEEDVNDFFRKTCYLHGIDFQRSYTMLTDAEKVKDTKMCDMGDVILDKRDFKVDKLVGKRIKNGRTEYWIKWEGWKLENTSWQTADTIFGSLVEDYERELLVKEEVKRRKGKGKGKGSKKEEEREEREVNQDGEERISDEGGEGETGRRGRKRKSLADRFSQMSSPTVSRPRRSSAQYSGGKGNGKGKKKEKEKGKGKEKEKGEIKCEDIVDLTNSDAEGEGESEIKRMENEEVGGEEKNEAQDIKEEKKLQEKGEAERKRKAEDEEAKEKGSLNCENEEITILQMRHIWGRNRYYTMREDPEKCAWETKDTLPYELIASFKKKKQEEPPPKRQKGKKYEVDGIVDYIVDEQGQAQFRVSWKNSSSKENSWLDEEEVPKELKKEFLAQERAKRPFRNIEAIFGGTPCKGFSLINRQRDTTHPLKNINNQLVLSFLDHVDLHRPEYGIVENVVGILSLAQGFVVKQIFHAYISMGYQVALHILNAVYYGAPQSRFRVIIFAAKNGLRMPEAPVPTHDGGGMRDTIPNEFHANIVYPQKGVCSYLPVQTVRQAIGDLPELLEKDKNGGAKKPDYKPNSPFSYYQRTMRQHVTTTAPENHEFKRFGKSAADMEDVPKDGPLTSDGKITFLGPFRKKKRLPNNKSANRSSWQRPFFTIVTNPSIQYASMVHPNEDRFFSPRELARGQGFPDHCFFYGCMQEQYRQIGNAVPSQLGAAIGREVVEAIRLSTKPGEKTNQLFCAPSVVLVERVVKGWIKKDGEWKKINPPDNASMGESGGNDDKAKGPEGTNEEEEKSKNENEDREDEDENGDMGSVVGDSEEDENEEMGEEEKGENKREAKDEDEDEDEDEDMGSVVGDDGKHE